MKTGYSLKVSFCIMLYLGTFYSNAQIIDYKNKTWEKAKPETSRDIQKCDNGTLLNFHCNIREHFRAPITYGKNEGQSLVVVHNSREDENVWNNKDIIAELNSNSFRGNGNNQSIELKKKPSIFSYLGSRQNSKTTKDHLNVNLEDRNLYEAVFIPRKIKKNDLEKVHSYLSLKYGISLEGVKYFNSKGDVIWDPEKHKDFQKRPTGIGRDDGNELYQKQSSNQEDKIVSIGRESIARTNFDNNSQLDNYMFAIWSDDDKDLSFEEKKDLKIMKRNWEINFIGNSIPKKGYVLQIAKNLMNPENSLVHYWLLIKNNDGTFQKIEGKDKDHVIEYAVDFAEERSSSIFTFATNLTGDKEIPAKNDHPVKTNGPGDATSDFQYLLYPNPVKMNNLFTVKFPETKDLEISIYDGGGRILSSEKINSKAVVYQHKLSIQGTYLVVLTQNKKLIKAFKVIVN
nr:T9SS type A sorting domain-containing protein [uncultured Chryseobacterium sp.]